MQKRLLLFLIASSAIFTAGCPKTKYVTVPSTPSPVEDVNYNGVQFVTPTPTPSTSPTPTPTPISAPSIISSPQDQGVISGQTAELEVVAEGIGLSFQWFIGNSGDESTPITSATGESYTTEPITSNMIYWVKVSNIAGTINSASAEVTELTSPTITQHPLTQTIVEGESVNLSVTVDSFELPSYQWFQGVSGNETTPVAGATSATMSSGALTAGTSYWVKVSNSAGSTNSNTASITVSPVGPTITTQPTGGTISRPIADKLYTTYGADRNNTTTTFQMWGSTLWIVNQGSIAQFYPEVTMSVSSSDSNATYQWYVGESGDTSSPVSDATGASLTTGSQEVWDNGNSLGWFPTPNQSTNYWVRITGANGAHTDSQTARVSITPQIPKLTKTISSSFLRSAQGLSVWDLSTTPVPGLSYQWYLGESGDMSTPVGGNSATYAVPIFTAPTTYWLRATIGLDSVNSGPITVTP